MYDITLLDVDLHYRSRLLEDCFLLPLRSVPKSRVLCHGIVNDQVLVPDLARLGKINGCRGFRLRLSIDINELKIERLVSLHSTSHDRKPLLLEVFTFKLQRIMSSGTTVAHPARD
jgi:hypothetical protein